MKILCEAIDVKHKGEKIGEVTVEEDTEEGEIILTFRAKSNSETVTFGNNEAKFTYREKKEQAPQTEQAKT